MNTFLHHWLHCIYHHYFGLNSRKKHFIHYWKQALLHDNVVNQKLLDLIFLLYYFIYLNLMPDLCMCEFISVKQILYFIGFHLSLNSQNAVHYEYNCLQHFKVLWNSRDCTISWFTLLMLQLAHATRRNYTSAKLSSLEAVCLQI